MRKLLPVIAALVLLAYASRAKRRSLTTALDRPNERREAHRVYGRQDVEPPDAAFATFVLESVIRAADPPGATGEITCPWERGTERPTRHRLAVASSIISTPLRTPARCKKRRTT